MAKKKIKSKSKRPTLKSRYEKQIKRLQRYQQRKEKEGYTFSSPLAPEIPDEEITKSLVKELESYKPRKLRGEDIVVNKYGEILAQKTGENIDDGLAYNYIDSTIELIENLPDYVEVLTGSNRHDFRVRPFPLHQSKRQMISLIWDTMNEYDNSADYDAYLESQFPDLQLRLDPDKLPSTEDELVYLIETSMRIIKGRSLTMEEAKMYSIFEEF